MSFPSKEEALFVDKEKFDLYCKKESKCKEKELNDRELIESIGGDKYGKEEEYERSEGLEKDVRVRLGGKWYFVVLFRLLKTYNPYDTVMKEQKERVHVMIIK